MLYCRLCYTYCNMALPKHKTTLSVLRTILGQGPGNAACFAKKIRKSESWLTKVSCGQMPLTEDAAVHIGYETGINVRWLLNGDPTKPPLDKDSNPYTAETYASHRLALSNGNNALDAAIADEDIGIIFHKLLQCYLAARIKNRGAYFAFKLENEMKNLAREFGVDDIKENPVAVAVANGLQSMISMDQMTIWNFGSSNAWMELMGVRMKYANKPFTFDETASEKKTPTRRKKQPSRKPKRASRR